ncbi:MAG: HAD hydrolase-like protein [Candidatus Diapherotrites archaeon]
MRIAFDLDEVVSETVKEWAEFHNRKFGTHWKLEHLHDYDLWKVWGGSQDEYLQEWVEFWKSAHFDSVAPVQGAVEGLKELRKKHELHIITSRSTPVREKTMEWIGKHFPGTFAGVHLVGKDNYAGYVNQKWEICHQIKADWMVEDRFYHARTCAEHGIPVLLLSRPWNAKKELPKNVYRVDSWNEIVQKLDGAT